MKQGLVLDRVVLLGRTFDEYLHYFNLQCDELKGETILDVASGVSSFCSEARERSLNVAAVDVIYAMESEGIRKRCETDLDHIVEAVRPLTVYRWQYYKSPEHMREYRERAYKHFLSDYREQQRKRYVAGKLPRLPFRDHQFSLALISYLLFVYEDQLDFEFHKHSILEIMRVASKEARIYPVVTFEGKRSTYLERLMADRELNHLVFEERLTDFEFLQNSNRVLVVRRREGD